MAIVFFRTLIIFSTLLLLMRLLGKRQMGELEPSELVVSVLIADLASMPLQDIGIPLLNGLVPIVILFSCELVIAGLTMHSVKLRAVICGKPCMLIKNGKIIQKNMRICRFTVDELTEELRNRDVSDISTVKYAILETNGTLNTVLYSAQMPPTAEQLGVNTPELGYPYVIIEEGRVLSENLRLSGHDRRWLEHELSSRGLSGPEFVYVMIAYDTGEVYFQGWEYEK
ncbi:MAG: DUF421 domain-containing protein [Butyricicoccus sp.]|nr:DUF421 domain-containing protein [Butyricicoccus sp.]